MRSPFQKSDAGIEFPNALSSSSSGFCADYRTAGFCFRLSFRASWYRECCRLGEYVRSKVNLSAWGDKVTITGTEFTFQGDNVVVPGFLTVDRCWNTFENVENIHQVCI